MLERKKALERLVAVKAQMQHLEEARLAEIETQKDRARASRDSMFGFLDRAEVGDSLLLKLACRRMAAVERGAARLDAEAAAQRQVVIRSGAQKLGAEKLLRAAAEALLKDEEKRTLLDIAEQAATARTTSLP
jgi:hypothetical protein